MCNYVYAKYFYLVLVYFYHNQYYNASYILKINGYYYEIQFSRMKRAMQYW